MENTPDLFEWAEQHAKENAGISQKSPSVDALQGEDLLSEEGGHALLVDAFSQIFRAFYAIRQLNNHRGEPVNALYIMTKLLLQIEKNYPSDTGPFSLTAAKWRSALNFCLSTRPIAPPCLRR